MRAIILLSSLSVAMLTTACSTSSSGRTQTVCPGQKLIAAPTQDKTLQLAPLSADDENRLGIGYVDITTSGANGEQTRRCTVGLMPVDGKPEQLRVITAQHCGWDSDSEEFANSKYTLQVWYRNGYFPVPIEPVGQREWGLYAKAVKPYLSYFPVEFVGEFFRSTSNAAMASCQSLTQELNTRNPLGHDILCFSATEQRILLGKISIDEKYRAMLNQVLAVVEKRKSQALANLPEPERTIFTYLANAPSTFELLPIYLKNIGFKINSKFCSTPQSEGPFDFSGNPEKRDLCPNRPLVLSLLKQISPEQYAIVQALADKSFSTSQEMVQFYNSNISCTFKDIETITAANFNPISNQCNLDQFKKRLWSKWAMSGLENMNTIRVTDTTLKGFNPQTYFSLLTNSVGSLQSATSGDHSNSQSRLHFINRQQGDIFSKGNSLAFLFNPKETNIWISKKDSGSLLNIFGVFPAAVISTYNGEPTSGGASILPLPIATEEDSPPKPQTGC